MSNVAAQYRGSAGDSSMDSIESQSSADTRDSMSGLNGTETLPCGNREVQPMATATTPLQQTQAVTTPQSSDQPQSGGYHWTLSNWSAMQATRRRNNSTTVRVDLASPEDISLDTDSTRVVFSAYGTTV